MQDEKRGGLIACGAALFIAGTIQFVVCIAVTASRYGPPAYNPVTITISDLQAVTCGSFQGTYVCSPFHDLANFSVAVLGLLISAGSLLIRAALPPGRGRGSAIGLLVVAGLAAFANAFTPEDVTYVGDLVTALVAFLGANFGLVEIGRTMSVEPRWGHYSAFTKALGIVGVAAIVLDGFGAAALLGNGGTEWFIISPILIWAPIFGIRLLL